jgi:hypothetical protein
VFPDPAIALDRIFPRYFYPVNLLFLDPDKTFDPKKSKKNIFCRQMSLFPVQVVIAGKSKESLFTESNMKLKDLVDGLVPPMLKRIHDATLPSPDATATPFSESVKVEGAETSSDTPSRYDWRNISRALDSEVELTPDEHKEICHRAYSAWCRNPLAGQIVNVTTWFVMGKGIGVTANDPAVQEAVSHFWTDPENDMLMTQHYMSNELQVYGEIFIRFFVNPISGELRIAMIDPSEIYDIVTSPDNIRIPIAYLREYSKPVSPSDRMAEFKVGSDLTTLADNVMREVIDADEILHVKVNSVSNHKRGISELYRVLPWLDAYDHWLQDRISLNRARGAFAFLRKVPTVPDRASGPFETDSSGRYIPPKPGSILVVHEGEDWQVLSPSIGSDDAREDGRAIKLMIAAGSGIFEHYFGDPSTGNLATARSMELPMVRKFEDRQRLFENVFMKIFQRVIDAGIIAGTIPPTVNRNIEINFPPIMPDDVSLLTDTLIKQIDSGLISKDSARRMIPWIANPGTEADAIEKEKVK